MSFSLDSFKLLVVDVDGTLVGDSGVPTPRVKEAIASLIATGARVALCSGRPLASCWPIVAELGLAGPHVVFNGALVKDPAAEKPVMLTPLPLEPTRYVIDFCREHDLCLELYTTESHYVEKDWEESRLHALSIRVDYGFVDFDKLFSEQQLVKCQIITSDDRGRDLAARLAEELTDKLGFSVAIPRAPCVGCECVNVVAPFVSKGQAVRTLIDYYGLHRDQVVGAGDAPNDLPMFAEVGYRIAMGGGDAEILAQGDLLAPGVEADGLAVAIEEILRTRKS